MEKCGDLLFFAWIFTIICKKLEGQTDEIWQKIAKNRFDLVDKIIFKHTVF